MKKDQLIILIVIVIVALGAAAYYFTVGKAEPTVWDGSYQMDGTLACEGNFPNLTTIPMNTDVTVSGNKIIDQFGEEVKNFEIDKRGRATEVIEAFTAQGITTSGEINFQFYKEDGVYKFTSTGSMTISTTQSGQTYSSTCSGTVVGVKQ